MACEVPPRGGLSAPHGHRANTIGTFDLLRARFNVGVVGGLRRSLAGFRRENRGSAAVESMILLPILFWTYLAMFSFFDMLRQQSTNQKAAFTIADMLSRETDKVDGTYLTNTHKLFKSLVRADTLRSRYSVITYDKDKNLYKVVWSKARGGNGVVKLNDNRVKDLRDKLPLISDGDQFILVESWNKYKLPFKIGLEDFEIETLVFMDPRFADQLIFG